MFVGRLGTELQFETILRGHEGLLVDQTDHCGRLLESRRQTEPARGQDVVLTIDSRLQRIVEEHLDRALARSALAHGTSTPHAGAAIVILESDTGAILASASAPRYNPNHFAGRDAEAIEQSLSDPARPLFDRATKMAIPPGSVFKIVTGLALLAESEFDPHAPFDCQGYSSRPDRQRCQIFRRYGVGHGPTTFSDAIARSCNVYFFHHAQTLGPEKIADWASRLGFGQPTGVDLPGEAAGFLPSPHAPGGSIKKWALVDTQALAIGQSTLTVTPLQIARMMAVIANGGYLVTPHLCATVEGNDDSTRRGESTAVRGLSREWLDLVRQSLVRVAADPEGTAYAVLADAGVPVAGKTGTAETGDRSADHAWFAGYAPSDAPRVAFVVVLEHQGSADQAAGIAKDLVQASEALGFLGNSPGLQMASSAGK
jgi:penicillin-binding protein 2